MSPGIAGTSLPIGPVQMLVLGFLTDTFTGEILPELRRLKEADVVRLIDLVVVRKDEAGEIEIQQVAELAEDEAVAFGGLARALAGVGSDAEDEEAAAGEAAEEGRVLDEESVWYLSDAIPPNTAAAIALIEHRWAIPLRNKILDAGGFALADEWIHPADLIAVGVPALDPEGPAS